jgi:hypothetical protein
MDRANQRSDEESRPLAGGFPKFQKKILHSIVDPIFKTLKVSVRSIGDG